MEDTTQPPPLSEAQLEIMNVVWDRGEATVDLGAAVGNLKVEWIEPDAGDPTSGEATTGGARRTFRSPLQGEALLHIYSE